MNIQKSQKGRQMVDRIQSTAQNLKAVDNNPLFDQDPRDNFVKVNQDDWNYSATFDQTGRLQTMQAATEKTYDNEFGHEPRPQSEYEVQRDPSSGTTSYTSRTLTSHEYSEYFSCREVRTEASDSGQIIGYDKSLYSTATFVPRSSGC